MRNLYYLGVISVALIGCSAPPAKVVTQYVQTPVRFCPAPPEVKRPWLEVQGLQPTDPDGVVALKIHASMTALKLYSHELEDIIQTYRDIVNQNPLPVTIKSQKPTGEDSERY